jgi:WhiB family transcriptional regulator, redox-sensing transcriptional regulator
MSWEERARCSEYDPDIFFDPSARVERRAKSICAQCPVRLECLAYALGLRAEFGVWGGLNGKERSSMLRRTRRAFERQRGLVASGTAR